MTQQLGFVHDDVVYVSDSFTLLRNRVLELGAHRIDNEPGTGEDIREIIRPLGQKALELISAVEGYVIMYVDEDGEYLTTADLQGRKLKALDFEGTTVNLEDVIGRTSDGEELTIGTLKATRGSSSIQELLEAVFTLTAALSHDYPSMGSDAAELGQELAEAGDVDGLRALRVLLEDEAIDPAEGIYALDRLLYGPRRKTAPLSVPRVAGAAEIEELLEADSWFIALTAALDNEPKLIAERFTAEAGRKDRARPLVPPRIFAHGSG